MAARAIATTGRNAVTRGVLPLTGGTLTGPLGLATYTWATKPSSATTGAQIFISDVGPKGSHWFYDGSRWKPVSNVVLLAALDTTSSSISNTDTVVFSYLMPAGLIQSKDRLRIRASFARSGTTDAASYAIRLGTAGSTADTTILGGALIASTNITAAFATDFRLESATTIQQLGTGAVAVAAGYSNAATAVVPAAVTISNVSNALYFTISISSAGTTNTTTLRDAQLDLAATPN